MGTNASRVFALTVALMPVGSLLAAQDTLTVSDLACVSCGVQIERFARIGGDDDSQYVTFVPWLPVDSRGRSFVYSEFDPGRIRVFLPDGSLIRILGQRGQGPGEFAGSLSLFIDSADSLHVFDGNARETVYGPDLELARMTRVPMIPLDAVFRDDGVAVVVGSVGTPEAFGFPLHQLDTSRRAVRSFGTERGLVLRPNQGDLRRVIAAAEGDRVWSMSRYSYVAELWHVDGSPLRAVRRPAAWFIGPDERSDSDPPSPAIVSLRADASGYLWVLILIPDERCSLGSRTRYSDRG